VNITQPPTGTWVRGNRDLGFLMKIENNQDGASVLERKPYDYVTEYILAYKYKFSQFDPKPKS